MINVDKNEKAKKEDIKSSQPLDRKKIHGRKFYSLDSTNSLIETHHVASSENIIKTVAYHTTMVGYQFSVTRDHHFNPFK